MPHLKTSEDASLVLELDPSFTGVLRGIAHDESEGCAVKGKCILKVNKTIKVRRLVVWFEGRCKVTLKGPSYANTEGTESRTLYTKEFCFIGDDGLIKTLTPGQYVYTFAFDLSPRLPASFRAKRGYIRYRLQAAVYRPMFASDILTSCDIPIRRCLLNDHRMADLRETYTGKHHTNKLSYTADAPTISYREGGLIHLNTSMHVTRPETQSIETVTCALRERIQYRTTDSFGRTALSKTDNLFPLGYSTFYPSQSPDYDPKEPFDLNTVFRLCPRVTADVNSKLIKINHALVINIVVNDTSQASDDNESCYETDVTESEWASDDDPPQRDTKQALPEDNPAALASSPDSVTLKRSSSASSLASLFSLGKLHTDDAMSTIPTIKNKRKHKHKHRHQGISSTICSIEIPLIVTSREDTWNAKSAPPSYEQAVEPPSYTSALNTLPKAPNYNGGDPTTVPPSSIVAQ